MHRGLVLSVDGRGLTQPRWRTHQPSWPSHAQQRYPPPAALRIKLVEALEQKGGELKGDVAFRAGHQLPHKWELNLQLVASHDVNAQADEEIADHALADGTVQATAAADGVEVGLNQPSTLCGLEARKLLAHACEAVLQ
eukprot:CAMPEP_0177771700 /NCGR_PEP_ID=MMETSP0491_2-20121128/11761_1 /TAXON_ID=63592 /ORGANISM="Tetraselmis chuii, Strain PLY429" /LENGTH=138 /DNA_ID=CAMNT_0019289325 /DNA_START=365 /DNA_END=782 /DNA_ORIENTATION=+